MYFGIARGRRGSPESLCSPTPAPRPVLAPGLEAKDCDPPVCEVSPPTSPPWASSPSTARLLSTPHG